MSFDDKNNTFKSLEQFNYWNNRSVYKWIKYDTKINFKFKEITKILLDNLKILESNCIMDIGCGSGFTTKNLADRVGKSGQVIGLDISLPLIKLFKKKYKNYKNIIIKQKDIQFSNLNRDKFDFVISRFGIMFFENPYVAFKNINKCLKKNGVLSFVSWTDFNYNQLFSIPMEAVTCITGIKKLRLTKRPGPFSFNNINYINDILKKSMFKNITINEVKTYLPADDIEQDVKISTSIGAAALAIRDNNLTKEQIKKINNLTYDLFNKRIHTRNKVFKAKIFHVIAAK